MKNIFLFIIFVFCFWVVNAWSYPLHYIYPNSCELGNFSCAYKLPIIEDAEYEKYRYNSNYNKVYTMLWGTTYFDGKDIGMGSHQWVDFASKLWTPVYAIYDWKIVLAEDKWNRWYVITIEHEWKGKKIYSSYAHLNKLLVSVWDIVEEWTLIAELGSSGNSTGPHLHFQIEINNNGEYPFFYKWCPGTISEIVNEWRCQKQMYDSTIDPILFIEKDGDIPFDWEIINPYLLDEITDVELINSLKIFGFLWWIVSLDDMPVVEIVSSFDDDSYLLDDKILIKNNSEYVDVFPNSVEVVWWKREVIFVPQKEGISFVNFQYWNKKLAVMPFVIQWYSDKNLDLKTVVLDNPYEKNGWIILVDIGWLDLNLEEDSFLLSSINLRLGEVWDYQKSLKYRFSVKSELQAFSQIQSILLGKKWLLLKWKKIWNDLWNIVLINGNNIVWKIDI